MELNKILSEVYGGIFEKELIDEISEAGHVMEFEENDVLIDFGRYIKGIPLLLKGAIKIMREDFDEGELLLYFLEKGDTCAMTMACCVDDKRSEIRAIAENRGSAVMIPIGKMENWMGKYKSWRAFVFQSYNSRFNELLSTIDNIAFKHMDERLEKYLNEKSKINKSKIINKTHQEIAYELNSSRVVISRLLKVMENEGKIRLNRNNIELL
ncbi:MAG: Crp/Fnr family transcriptional regulator [Moheibacter sp.]